MQPGTWIDPAEVVAIREEKEGSPGIRGHGGWSRTDVYLTLRNGIKFWLPDTRADKVRAILWPDDA